MVVVYEVGHLSGEVENNSQAVTKCQIFDSFDTHFFSLLNQVIL